MGGGRRVGPPLGAGRRGLPGERQVGATLRSLERETGWKRSFTELFGKI